jgi:acyl carrier protein
MSERDDRAERPGDPALDTIRGHILAQFPQARRRIRGDDDPLLETGVVDSLGIFEIVNFLIAEFGIAVEDTDLTPENFGTIRALARFVRAKLPVTGGTAPR